MIQGDIAVNSEITERGFLLALTGLLSCRISMVAFLNRRRFTANITDKKFVKLTIIVKLSLRMKSRTVPQMALLERPKLLE